MPVATSIRASDRLAHPLGAGVAVGVPDDISALFRHRFSEAAIIGTAAAGFASWTNTPAGWLRWKGETLPASWIEGHGMREGVVWSVEVSPGSVAIRRQDRARIHRTAERQIAAQIAASLEGMSEEKQVLGYSGLGGRDLFSLVERKYSARVGDGLVREPRKDRAPRGRITCWSKKSRAAMVKRLATLDYRPMVGRGAPAMVTLTYPGDWLPVAPDAATCVRHLGALRKRYARAWGHSIIAVWKREFQRRGAPHFHLLMVPPVGLVDPNSDRRDFRTWLSEEWADIVGHPDPDERAAHQRAGTNVDVREGARYTDPRRVGVYFSKHGTFSAKDYQNEAPVEWLHVEGCPALAGDECVCEGGPGIGRFWGVWGLSPVVASQEVPAEVADAVRRLARRWHRSTLVRDGVPVTVPVKVWRTDTKTGVQRQRNSRKRLRPHLGGRAGFLCVNDGPGLALELARYAELVHGGGAPRSSFLQWSSGAASA